MRIESLGGTRVAPRGSTLSFALPRGAVALAMSAEEGASESKSVDRADEDVVVPGDVQQRTPMETSSSREPEQASPPSPARRDSDAGAHSSVTPTVPLHAEERTSPRQDQTGAGTDATAIASTAPSPGGANASGLPDPQELELAAARKRRRQWLYSQERNDPEEAFQRERPFLQHVPLAATAAGATESVPEALLCQLRRNPYGDSRASALAYTLGLGGRLLLHSTALYCRRMTGMWGESPKGRCIQRVCARKIDAETGTVLYWCGIRANEDAGDSTNTDSVTWRWLRRRTLARLAPEKLLDFDRRHPETPHIARLETLKQQGKVRYTREALDPCLVRLQIAHGRLNLDIYASHVEITLPDTHLRPYRPTLHLAGKVCALPSTDSSALSSLMTEPASRFYARLRHSLAKSLANGADDSHP